MFSILDVVSRYSEDDCHPDVGFSSPFIQPGVASFALKIAIRSLVTEHPFQERRYQPVKCLDKQVKDERRDERYGRMTDLYDG